ncbi:MAG: hypothetical protein R3300_18410 [Candidatus Promineifilaceae bacterium]|nr:hypothetical protein [Candidatus Promineifilaceae bacterium]
MRQVWLSHTYYCLPRRAALLTLPLSLPDLPDELTSAVTLMSFPPFPEVPEPLRGQSFILTRGCYCGSSAEGRRLLRYWRYWQTPLMDLFGEMPFSQVATISNDPVDPVPALSSGAWLAELSDEAAATIIRYGQPVRGQPAFLFVEVCHAGGAMARGPADRFRYSYARNSAP